MFVGSREITITDESSGVSFPTWVLYPTLVPSAAASIGPYSVDVSKEGEIAEGEFPVVVISHGSGGSHLGYRTIATYLAKQGFIVAMPEHHGNNRNNNSWDGTLENLTQRPRHVRLVLDAMASGPELSRHGCADVAAIIGHSMGGYTALAVAGGAPRSELGHRVEVTRDSRVKSLVLLAPATPWYQAEGALSALEVPILMLSAEHDLFTPSWHAELVRRGLPDESLLSHRVVENAGHFSFLSPFPQAMTGPNFPPSMDPAGFDRTKFQQELCVEIGRFLSRTLVR